MSADLISDFCAWYHVYHNISEPRRREQERILRLLEGSLDGRGIAELTMDDLEGFLAARDVAPGTILKYLRMIRPFTRWMWKHGEITSDQFMHLRDVKAPRGAGWSPPKPYSRHEIACFWEYFEHQYPWTGDRDPDKQTTRRAEFFVRRWQRGTSDWSKVWPYARRLQAEAIVALALYGGLRRIEIFGADIDEIHYENAYVRVRGAAKNPAAESRDRAVPMNDEMRVAMSNWLEFREQVLQPSHDRPWLCLWRERFLEPMTLENLAHMMDKIGDGYSLHRLRHTFATERLRSGMAAELVQSAMGHHDIAQTLRYTKIGAEQVIASAARTDADFMAAVGRGT